MIKTSFYHPEQSLKPSMDYIVTQNPLSSTVVDFWRLVYDHDIDIIVSLNSPDKEQKVHNSGTFPKLWLKLLISS